MSNPFGKNSKGSTVGKREKEQWVYPSMGYNAAKGVWYIDDEAVKEVKFVPIAARECKELGYWQDTQYGKQFKIVYRYHIKESRENMAVGDYDLRNRIQVLGVVNGEYRLWGASSYTVRWFWTNPKSGQYKNSDFELGMLEYLDNWCDEKEKEYGVHTTHLCWELNLKSDDELTDVGFRNNTSYAKLVKMVGDPVYVGDETADKYGKFYVDEDLKGWIAQWQDKSLLGKTVEPEEEDVDEEPVDPEENFDADDGVEKDKPPF